MAMTKEGLALLLALSGRLAAGEAISLEESLAGNRPFATDAAFSLRTSFLGDDALRGISLWQLQFFDSENSKVDFIQGRGAPRFATLQWHGITRDGKLLRDGFYSARFAWVDDAGRRHATAPIRVGVISPPGLDDVLEAGVTLAFRDDATVLRLPESLTFPVGQAALKPRALPLLKKVAALLLRFPDKKIVVEGYSDTTGADRINELVSSRRARAVYDFLVGQGFDAERLTFAGLGAVDPVSSNATAGGRAKNRRVDIVVRNGII
jgi:outer membrane protein OmpA-like peptidoglycan-associated protein